MNQIFKKVMVLTDLHFGRSGSDKVALQDNMDFLGWAADRARSWGAETCIFMGDWFDNRNTINVVALNYALDGIELLNSSFDKSYWLFGNHDLPWRESRNHSSLEIARNLKNIELIRNPLTIGDVTFIPWLVGDESKSIKHCKSRYVFGHLELPGFKMNSMVTMPDSPTLLKPDQLAGPEHVFTGHYHARQSQKFNNTIVTYIGSCMGMNFSDNWDEDRGIMLLEWGCDPIFESWSEQPLYRTTKLSDILADPTAILRPKMTVRALVDVSLHYEEAQEIRDALQSEYGVRKLELVHVAAQDKSDQEFRDERVTFKSVDQMVIDGILSVESTGISPARLVEIYRGLA